MHTREVEAASLEIDSPHLESKIPKIGFLTKNRVPHQSSCRISEHFHHPPTLILKARFVKSGQCKYLESPPQKRPGKSDLKTFINEEHPPTRNIGRGKVVVEQDDKLLVKYV